RQATQIKDQPAAATKRVRIDETSSVGLRRATQRLVRNSLSSHEPRVQGTAREQHLVQCGLGGRLGDGPLAIRVEVMLCDSPKKFFDECGTCAICPTSEIVHQL